jgi:hypothetical protein
MCQVPRIQKARGERSAAQAGRFRPAGRGQVRPPGRRQQGRFPAFLLTRSFLIYPFYGYEYDLECSTPPTAKARVQVPAEACRGLLFSMKMTMVIVYWSSLCILQSIQKNMIRHYWRKIMW